MPHQAQEAEAVPAGILQTVVGNRSSAHPDTFTTTATHPGTKPPAPRTAAEGREELHEAPAAGRISRAAIKLLVTPQLRQPDKDTRYPLTYIKRGS